MLLFAENLLVTASMCCSQWKEFLTGTRENSLVMWVSHEHLADCGCLLSMWTEKAAAMSWSLFGWCFIDRFPGHKVVLPGSYPNTLLGEDQFWNQPRRNHKREMSSNVSRCVFMNIETMIRVSFWHTLARKWKIQQTPCLTEASGAERDLTLKPRSVTVLTKSPFINRLGKWR